MGAQMAWEAFGMALEGSGMIWAAFEMAWEAACDAMEEKLCALGCI